MAIRQKMVGRRSTMLLNAVVPDRPERTEMINAILANNLKNVCKLIQNQESLNVTDQQGRTYLHYSAYFDKAEITDHLIKAGLKADSRDNDFSTPLHSACFNNSLNSLKLLIERGADLNSRDRNWLTPLHICAASESNECLLFLIQNLASLNITDLNGATALHYASSNGFNHTILILLKAGANPKQQDTHGRTCLHYSVLQPNYLVVQLLLDQNLDVNLKDKYGMTPLHIACTTLNFNCVELLIQYGANVNEIDAEGNSPLHYACLIKQEISIYDKSSEARKTICKLLIDNGADLEAKNNLLLTPLHLVYENGPVLDAYIKMKLDFDCRDYMGRTPLHIACYKGYNSLVDALIANGADIQARDKLNRTPLHYSVEYGQYTLVSNLIGRDRNLISLVDDNNCNSLHYAAKLGIIGIWNKLIEVYHDFDQKDNFGRTVHFYAAHSKIFLRNCLPLPSFLDLYNRNLYFYTLKNENNICSSDSLEYLLNMTNLKLDINQRDVYGKTPLHYAYMLKLDFHVDILLKHGASLYVEDENELMPLHYLILTDNYELLTTLIENGRVDLNQNRYKICLMQFASFHGAHFCLKILIKNNYKYYSSLTKCLEYATWNQHADCVEIILNLMVRTKTINDLYKSCALHISALKADFRCFSRLLANLDKSDIRDENGRTTMMFALINCKEKNYCIDFLLKRADCDLNALDSENRNVLFYCVIFGNLEMFRLFLKSGVNALQKCSSGKTVLHLAALFGDTEILSCLMDDLKQKNISYDQLLDNEGFNPLHYGCYKGNLGIVKLLIESFPENNLIVNSFKKISYLHLASYSGNAECIKLILNHFDKSIINHTDSKGRNALHYLCMSKRAQISSNVNSSTLNQTSNTPAANNNRLTANESLLDEAEINQKQLTAYKILVNNQININCKDKFSKTPLMIAIQNECCRLSLCLIDEPSIDLLIRDQNGCTVLHYASKFKNELAGQKLIRKDTTLVNLANNLGRTALHISSSNGLFELTKSLLSSGASCFIQDSYGFTPALTCAKNNDVSDCLDLIIEVMLYDYNQEKCHNDTNNISQNLTGDRESIRCSSPILETRKSLINQRGRRSETSNLNQLSGNFEEDLHAKHFRRS